MILLYNLGRTRHSIVCMVNCEISKVILFSCFSRIYIWHIYILFLDWLKCICLGPLMYSKLGLRLRLQCRESKICVWPRSNRFVLDSEVGCEKGRVYMYIHAVDTLSVF